MICAHDAEHPLLQRVQWGKDFRCVEPSFLRQVHLFLPAIRLAGLKGNKPFLFQRPHDGADRLLRQSGVIRYVLLRDRRVCIYGISYEDIPEKELIDLAQRELWPSSTRMQTPYDFEEERLTKAFMELLLKRRQVMELLFLTDLSETETAKRLNCSLQYVRNQRCIALKKLRSRLMEGGDDE